MAVDIQIEELAERLKKLTPSERVQLKVLVGEEWFEASEEKERKTINKLLEKSKKQFEHGEAEDYRNIINESKKKYGL